MRAGSYWRVTCGGLFGTCTNSILGCSKKPRIATETSLCDVGLYCKTVDFRSGPDETRTRDLRHARAEKFGFRGAPLPVVGEWFRHSYGKCGKSCTSLRVDVCGRFLAALV